MQQFIINEDLSFFYLNSEDIENTWEHLCLYLEKSVPYSSGYISLEQYKNMITQPETNYGVWTVWFDERMLGVIITKFERIGNCLVLDYETMAGSDIHLWLEESITNFERLMSKEFNVDQFRIIGRPGWFKILKNIGYDLSHTVIIKKNKYKET